MSYTPVNQQGPARSGDVYTTREPLLGNPAQKPGYLAAGANKRQPMNLMATAAPPFPPAPGYPSAAPAYSDGYPESYPPPAHPGYPPMQHPVRSASKEKLQPPYLQPAYKQHVGPHPGYNPPLLRPILVTNPLHLPLILVTNPLHLPLIKPTNNQRLQLILPQDNLCTINTIMNSQRPAYDPQPAYDQSAYYDQLSAYDPQPPYDQSAYYDQLQPSAYDPQPPYDPQPSYPPEPTYDQQQYYQQPQQPVFDPAHPLYKKNEPAHTARQVLLDQPVAPPQIGQRQPYERQYAASKSSQPPQDPHRHKPSHYPPQHFQARQKHFEGDLHKKRNKNYKEEAVEQAPPAPKIDTRTRPMASVTSGHISEAEFSKTFCYDCMTKFNSEMNLLIHKKGVKHSAEIKYLHVDPHPPPQQFCHLCNMWFPNGQQLTKHVTLLLHAKTRTIFEKYGIPIPGEDYAVNPKQNIMDDDEARGISALMAGVFREQVEEFKKQLDSEGVTGKKRRNLRSKQIGKLQKKQRREAELARQKLQMVQMELAAARRDDQITKLQLQLDAKENLATEVNQQAENLKKGENRATILEELHLKNKHLKEEQALLKRENERLTALQVQAAPQEEAVETQRLEAELARQELQRVQIELAARIQQLEQQGGPANQCSLPTTSLSSSTPRQIKTELNGVRSLGGKMRREKQTHYTRDKDEEEEEGVELPYDPVEMPAVSFKPIVMENPLPIKIINQPSKIIEDHTPLKEAVKSILNTSATDLTLKIKEQSEEEDSSDSSRKRIRSLYRQMWKDRLMVKVPQVPQPRTSMLPEGKSSHIPKSSDDAGPSHLDNSSEEPSLQVQDRAKLKKQHPSGTANTRKTRSRVAKNSSQS